MTKIYIGADISKSKINFALYKDRKLVQETEIENSKKALKKFVQHVKSAFRDFELILIMEHTGIYNNLILELVVEFNICTHVVHAIEIKRSSGLKRGKDDQIDARNIAEYGFRYEDKLKTWNPKPKNIAKLKYLSSQRERMVKVRKQLKTAKLENKKFIPTDLSIILDKSTDRALQPIEKEIKQLERLIRKVAHEDESLKDTIQILESIPGIGPITAVALICYTNNFTSCDSYKQLASYCGCAPFPNSSGIYKGKDRVSHYANKKLKTLLTMCSLSQIGRSSIFSEYYNRLLLNKKHHSVALNNVRNKYIKTIFACVRNKVMYEKDYQYSFVNT